MMEEVNISDLLGKTLVWVEVVNVVNDEIHFKCSDGSIYNMFHSQQCCENVEIEDIDGDLQDLIGSPITIAEEVTSDKITSNDDEEWTFYKIGTIKDTLTIRWYG